MRSSRVQSYTIFSKNNYNVLFIFVIILKFLFHAIDISYSTKPSHIIVVIILVFPINAPNL